LSSETIWLLLTFDIVKSKSIHYKYIYANNKILLSFGGSRYSKLWEPDAKNVSKLADEMLKFVTKYNLDGMDFDLEGANVNAKTSFLIDLITELRTKATALEDSFSRDFFITAAPWADGSEGHLIWAENRNSKCQITDLIQTQISDKPCFDALFIQDYNPGSGLNLYEFNLANFWHKIFQLPCNRFKDMRLQA
jgi:chitinase